ncbi:hypothetical protein KBY71_04440 [Cyanobium sp. T1B-Tous]|uniref:hypothetical protein n=1 Tax=Cyanobium sp. T1B-Tous TaxID=2823721 RepID=UPI0020CDEBF6|nr:hypothetical protein [Cyanobium sp. T1B-Tous]MCP9805770.1 hypothetical protein [Cyanobium sp. T1B-Tous]
MTPVLPIAASVFELLRAQLFLEGIANSFAVLVQVGDRSKIHERWIHVVVKLNFFVAAKKVKSHNGL